MNDNEQIATLGQLINKDLLFDTLGIDLIIDSKSSSTAFYKYYKNRRRCYAPKILIHILSKYPDLQFYIAKSELKKNTESNNIYHEITLDFNLEQHHTFNIIELKSFINAKFLNFYKTEDKNIIKAEFNYLKISLSRELAELIKQNIDYHFTLIFEESKEIVKLEKCQ